MIRFEKDRFVVEVSCGLSPQEDWARMTRSLVELIMCQDKDMHTMECVRGGCELLLALLPDEDTACHWGREHRPE